MDVASRRARFAFRLTVVAFVWSLGLLIAAVTVPAYGGHTETSGDGVTITKVTLVVENGAWVLIPVAVPALVCALVAVALRRKSTRESRRAAALCWAAIAGLAVFALLLILSIGGYLLPVVLLLAGAARLTPLRTVPERSRPRPAQV